MIKPRTIIRIVLLVVAVFTVFEFARLRISINEKETEIKSLSDEIKTQRLRNQEYESILDEENKDDFYRSIAEDELGYGVYDEKIYKNIVQ